MSIIDQAGIRITGIQKTSGKHPIESVVPLISLPQLFSIVVTFTQIHSKAPLFNKNLYEQ